MKAYVLIFIILLFPLASAMGGVVIDPANPGKSPFFTGTSIDPANPGGLTGASTTKKIPIVFSTYDAEPARSSESNIYGGVLSLTTGAAVDTNTNATASQGIGKTLIVINTGSDVIGTLKVNGTKIDRVTGAVTSNYIDSIIIDGLSIDNTANDGNGNPVHNYSHAYLTNVWFSGGLTYSSTNLTITDMDIYHVSFEQANDMAGMTLKTFDVNLLATGTAAEFDAYLYLLQKNAQGIVNISQQSSLHLGTLGVAPIANRYYRLRKGLINVGFDGTTDGFWVDVHYSNSPALIEDVTLKVWIEEEV